MKKKLPKNNANRIIADISVPLFKIAARFTSHEPERAYLCGVRIVKHPKLGILMVATDGHRMLVIHDSNGRCTHPMTLDAKHGRKVARSMDKSTDDEETRWRVRDGRNKIQKGERRTPLIDLPYPEWINIPKKVATTRGGAAFAVNSIYLADFARAARELSPKQHPRIRCVPGESGADPVLVQFPNSPHVFGVLMPMLDHTTNDLPSFIAPLLAAKTGPKNK
jgi:hypothetical protein